MGTKHYSLEFIKYQKKIFFNPVYDGMPKPEKTGDSLPWVAPKSSKLGKARLKWWEKKKRSLITIGKLQEDAKISDVARFIHPYKHKPCQTCGKKMSIQYIYPTKNLLKKLNNIFPKVDISECLAIKGILKSINNHYPKNGINDFINEFELNLDSCDISEVTNAFQIKKKNLLGPGVMSNAPDRFDGFHSYNKCCRSKEDSGRSSENLKKYGEDRRAYENWVDGDWKAASWLMKEYSKNGVSPDHIGPISLGFCHDPCIFTPMTLRDNSAKGNRLTLDNVKTLIALEKQGHTVVSWHTKLIWDKNKTDIKSDEDALNLSKTLRTHFHKVLLIFYELKKRGYDRFLESLLNPQYAFYSIKIIGFNPHTGTYKRIVKTYGKKTQYQNNATRYKKIAFESLEKYKTKENRKQANINEQNLLSIMLKVETTISSSNFQNSKKILQGLLEHLQI